jgi:hypothetical protein
VHGERDVQARRTRTTCAPVGNFRHHDLLLERVLHSEKSRRHLTSTILLFPPEGLGLMQVWVRSRPVHSLTSYPKPNPGNSAADPEIIQFHGKTLQIESKTFKFHNSILSNDQEQVFEDVTKSLSEDFRRGFSVTLMAYGQTGSGKTHTMIGKSSSLTRAALETSSFGVHQHYLNHRFQKTLAYFLESYLNCSRKRRTFIAPL